MAQENPNNPTGLLRTLFDAGISAVDAAAMLPPRLPVTAGRLVAIAIGKAAVPMMAAVQRRSTVPLPGLVVAPHGHVPAGTGWPGVRIITAGHPVPDADSLTAAEAALAMAAGLGADDHLLMLVSGGGSAVLAAPIAGVTMDEKAAITRALLRSGAPITAINIVRKALSRIKGGKLAAATAPAAVTTWIISDIPGDDPGLVASGPTVAGPTVTGPGGDAQGILSRYGIGAPQGAAGDWGLATQARFDGDAMIVARPRDALDAIGRAAAALGFEVVDLGDDLEGEARDLAVAHGALARQLATTGGRHAIISGGETSVTMVGTTGRGGRNLEYALALAIALDGAADISALAADSDGIDGSCDAAGAIIDPGTLARARALGLDPAAFLAAHDAHGFFATLGDLVVTGPTLTNVNDIRIILVA